jgi:hypothetical protein
VLVHGGTSGIGTMAIKLGSLFLFGRRLTFDPGRPVRACRHAPLDVLGAI